MMGHVGVSFTDKPELSKRFEEIKRYSVSRPTRAVKKDLKTELKGLLF